MTVANELKAHFKISDADITAGLENARNPGRLEYQGRYLFDGAHNVGGAKALAGYLEEFEQRSITLIFGAMRDKSAGEILNIIAPLAVRIILTEPSNTRSLSYDELLGQIPSDRTRGQTFATDCVANAIDIAEAVTPHDGIILVTGSLYLVGEVKKILQSQI